MSSPGQRRGICGHVMAGFDKLAHCARCRDKLKVDDSCVSKKTKEKREQRTALADKSAENVSETLVDPCLVVSPDKSLGYLGFSMVTPPPPQRFPFGRDNLNKF